MEKLIDTEIKILQYCRNVQVYEDGLDTFVKIPEEFTKAQFTVACDSLEEKGMIKTFYCEGHILQEVRVLDKGQCYLDNLKENQEIGKDSCTNVESLIDSISIGRQNRQTTIWNNGVIGQIIDLESNGEFHLIDYIDANTINPLYWGDSNELKNSKIIATGIVGWWLHNKRRNTIGNIKDFYKGYADKCYQDFQNSKQSDPMFMNMDLKKIFFGGIHQNKEKEFIQKSQSLLPFLTTEDIFTINNMIDGYWTIIKDEYENQTNKPMSLRDFLNLFGSDGTAYKCLCLMEKSHGFSVIRKESDINQYNAKGYGSIDITQIYKESINVDFNIFDQRNIPLMEEIKTLLERDDDASFERLCLQILNSLELFGSLIYPLAQCRTYKKRIQDLNKQKIENPQRTESADKSISFYKEEIQKLQNNSEKFREFFVEEWAQQNYLESELEYLMCKYMHLYVMFVKNLDALLMIYGKDLLEYEHKFGIYLCQQMDVCDLIGVQQLSSIDSVRYFYLKLSNRANYMKEEELIMSDTINDEWQNGCNPTNLAMEKQDSISIDLDEEQIAVLAFFSDGKEHFDTPENIENEDYWGICEELENMSLLIAPLTKDNGYKISRKGKKLYMQILSEQAENMSELDYLILNTLRLHGNQINPNQESSKQIYDFEELSLYTQDEISDCSIKLENMGFISIFRDEGPAYWHKLLDPGRVLLRKYLCGQDSQNNKQNNKSKPDEEEKSLGIESILPNALKTKRSIFYFNMAIDKGVIKLENGKLSWVKIGNVGSMSQLAYFCGRVYEYDHTLNGNAGTQFPEIELNALFGVTRLQSLLDQVYKAKKIQSWRRNIDELFE